MFLKIKIMPFIVTVFFLSGVAACTSPAPIKSSAKEVASPEVDSVQIIQNELDVKVETEDPRVIVEKRPCRMNDGSDLERKPEIKAGISKTIGSKKKKVFIEYDCGTSEAH